MELTFKGATIYLSRQDLGLLKTHVWHVHKTGKKQYLRGYPAGQRKKGLVYLHKILVPKSEVDHRDGNGLNNMRSNLRRCDRSDNNANRRDLGTKGVHFDRATGRYRAQIEFKRKRYSLGRFKTFKEAKRAYNLKAKQLFGGFANYKIV